jgi:thiol-disulfide isomerase/thioredoxin
MKNIHILVFLGLFSACSSPAYYLTNGLWRGVFHVQDAEIPFLFDVKSADTENPTVTLINGEERVELSDVTYRNDSVIIPIRIYDAVMEAKVDRACMTGRLVKLYSNRADSRVPFTAQKGMASRFTATGEKATASLDGRWDITVPARDMAGQVGIFRQKADGYLVGSILTPTGDYRYLEGTVQADRFYLSAFAGMTPYLIRGQFTGADGFTAEFITPAGISHLKGERNPDASLPDAYAMTTLKPGYTSLGFRLPDLDGREVSLDDPKYDGQVVIVSLLGSWCPNCLDETAFLAPWYKANRVRGVEVIGLAFERKDDIEYAKNQLSVFMEQLGVTYDILFAGRVGDETVAKVLPELNRIMSYPTTVFIDKKGQVRKIHAGFSGPATGKFYEEFKTEFNRTVDELVDE